MIRFANCLGLINAACALGGLTAFGAPAAERLVFREPALAAYVVETGAPGERSTATASPAWLRAHREGDSTNAVWLGDRVVLQTDAPTSLPALLGTSELRVDRVLASNLFVLQAPSALAAARESARIAQWPGVRACHPVRRGRAMLHGGYAPQPNDSLFHFQWHLENRDTNTAAALGFDLNARSAWADNRGQGILVGQGDNGVDGTHPDLKANMSHGYHHNFITGTSNGGPSEGVQPHHGTAVAGLIAARGDNARGVVGLAPQAELASLVIFDSAGFLASEEAVMDAFQYRSNIIRVQNHSWGNAATAQLPLGALENQGLAQAVTHGREGRGVVFVRSAGNERLKLNDVNDDGYGQDPRAITVGAVRTTGRATSYSTPGAPVLVAAFSGDPNVDTAEGGKTNYVKLATTDRQGSLGANPGGNQPDYAYLGTGFHGTSGTSPQIAGLCALILAANPALTYRDVQHVLIGSARQLDPADPDLQVNGAGFAVSHSVGFGVPDAGEAVGLARAWTNRPAPATASAVFEQSTNIPDDGLRVLIGGPGVPAAIASIPAFPSDGLHPDDPTPVVPLVDVGLALAPMAIDLTGRAALIQRGQNTLAQKVAFAAAAGARFVVMGNNRGVDERFFAQGADLQYSPIPMVFIGQTAGEELRAYVARTPDATAQLQLLSIKCALPIDATLLCEHVRLRAVFSHPSRADVRLTLVSPAGTRSVLHRFNNDTTSALGDWTFHSTHHFYESSAGTWQAEISDERPGATGSILALELTVEGVPIQDADHDGLDDAWELARIGTLARGPKDDPDADGLSNMREQLLGKDPVRADRPFQVDLGRWNQDYFRLSWPASEGYTYDLLAQPHAGTAARVIATQAGRFPELAWIVAQTNTTASLFHVRQTPIPASGR